MERPVANDQVLIAQLTDTHVVDPAAGELTDTDNNARLADAVASIANEDPAIAAVVATGDLTQWGTDAEYSVLVDLLSPIAERLLPIPGNHDEREPMRERFGHVDWVDASHASWVSAVGHVRMIGLDSTRPDHPGGAFDGERESWLRSVLEAPHPGPTILAMHHPPFETGIGWMDSAGFAGLDRLVAVLDDLGRPDPGRTEGRGGVDRIVCGHLHRPMSSAVAGVPAEVGPATTVHVALDLGVDRPIRVIHDPVGYKLLRIAGDSVVAHVRYTSTDAVPIAPVAVTAPGRR